MPTNEKKQINPTDIIINSITDKVEKDITNYLQGLSKLIKSRSINYTVLLLRRGSLFADLLKSKTNTVDFLSSSPSFVNDMHFLCEIYQIIKSNNISTLSDMSILVVDDAITTGSKCVSFLKKILETIIYCSNEWLNFIEISSESESFNAGEKTRNNINKIRDEFKHKFDTLFDTVFEGNANITDLKPTQNILSTIVDKMFPKQIILSSFLLNNSHTYTKLKNSLNYIFGDKVVLEQQLIISDESDQPQQVKLFYYSFDTTESYLRYLDNFIIYLLNLGKITDWDHVLFEIKMKSNKLLFSVFWSSLSLFLDKLQISEKLYEIPSDLFLHRNIKKIGIFDLPLHKIDEDFYELIKNSVSQAKLRFIIYLNKKLDTTSHEELFVEKILIIPIINVNINNSKIDSIIKKFQERYEKFEKTNINEYKNCSVPEISILACEIAVFCVNVVFGIQFITNWLINDIDITPSIEDITINHEIVGNVLEEQNVLMNLRHKILDTLKK